MIFWMAPELGHADELADLVGAQVVEPGEGEGEVLLLDLLDDLLELNSLFTLELMVEHAVKVTTETINRGKISIQHSAFSKQRAHLFKTRQRGSCTVVISQ